MGLDMYLTKETYIGAEYEHNKIEGSVSLTKDGKPIKIDLSRIQYITEKVGYWRKANHIHKWFVENVQNGEDNCEKHYVSQEQLEALKQACEEAIQQVTVCPKTVTTEKDWQQKEYEYSVYDVSEIEDDLVLPTGAGFFFGSTDYDEWYISDCQETIKIVDSVLTEDSSGADYYYRSSW